jgi:hypothetical protein
MRHFLVLALTFALVASASAYPGGAPNGYAGNPPNNNSCVNCHSSYPLNSGDGYVEISGLPGGGYQSGVTYNLTATVDDPGQVRWGFQLTPIYQQGSSYLQAGNLIVTDPSHTSLSTGSGTAPDYLNQTSAGTYDNTSGPTSWNFNWTAPDVSTGTLTFYIAGMGSNSASGTNGDYVYTTSYPVNPSGGFPDVWVTVTPLGSTTIPVTGGNLDWNFGAGNNEAAPQTVDLWADITLPNGSLYGPILGPVQNFALPAGWSGNRDRVLAVPGGAPAGTYSLNGYVGEYNPPNNVIYGEDSFDWTKSASGDGEFVGGWFSDNGESFDETVLNVSMAALSALHSNYPNPFNPTTTLSFDLAEPGFVNLAVYDVSGRTVAELVDGWRASGAHEVTFDASDLSAGIYIARMETNGYSAIQKMVFVK